MPTDGHTKHTGLSGVGLQQSRDQWEQRGEALAKALSELATAHAIDPCTSGLDVGCQDGTLTDAIAQRLGGRWVGIDPGIPGSSLSPQGRTLMHGWAHDLPFDALSFDVVIFANVFEHVDPAKRLDSLREMHRVLRPAGILVGQLPNPYFFIESHSRLPFMGYLPVSIQKRYWRFAPVPWQHDFYVVTIKALRADALRSGFEISATRNFNYPVEVIPRSVQWAARALRPVVTHIPWAWQFVLRRAA
jgi:SAM-dependent methyltransferase